MSFEKYIWTEKVLRLPHGAVTAALELRRPQLGSDFVRESFRGAQFARERGRSSPHSLTDSVSSIESRYFKNYPPKSYLLHVLHCVLIGF